MTPRPGFLISCLCAIAILSGLGVWQVQRLAWKTRLIASVEQRLHSAPLPAPPPNSVASLAAYQPVTVTGRFLNDRETLVQAVTRLGAGFWILTPLRTEAGFTVLINRGFVPAERRAATDRAAGRIEGATRVTGLLRLTEPKGGFLRRNDPAHDRWYARDVAAIAQARGLTNAAPYFIDAGATPNAGGLPVGGLTVVRFPNNHLQYALTWFAMALMLAGWLAYSFLNPAILGAAKDPA